MRKLVVLGSVGMAGHIMAEYMDGTKKFQVYGIARGPGKYVTDQLDVTDLGKLESVLEKIKPDYVINCIGVLVSSSEQDISNAIQINSYLPHFLSSLGNIIGFKLFQISTDCVFSGKDGLYSEASFRDGDDNYARTKALGEVNNKKDLTIRTSIIGPELKKNGTGLLDWFFKQSSEIKGYTRAYWSGVTTLELAKATNELINQNITGLFQLCPETKISKYDLLVLFSEVWDKKIRIVQFDDYTVDKSLVCTRKDFEYATPDYKEMLVELRAWMDGHTSYYAHYNL